MKRRGCLKASLRLSMYKDNLWYMAVHQYALFDYIFCMWCTNMNIIINYDYTAASPWERDNNTWCT